jgi:hypothetical protein
VAARANTDRDLYAPFASLESAVLEAALLLQPHHSRHEQPLRLVLEALVESAENVSAPRTAWLALARVANLLDWHEGHEVANDLYERIRGGLSRSVQSGDPAFTVWGYDERTEAGRHVYVYLHAYDYLHDRSAPIPFRLELRRDRCNDMLRVTSDGLRSSQTMEVCIAGSCVFANAAGGVTFTDLAASLDGVAEVRILIREGGVLVSEQRQNRPLEDFRPNGTGCPPTCTLVQVLVDERGFKEPLGGRIPH